MSGCGILRNCSLFLKGKVQNKILLAESVTMEGVIVSIPKKLCNYWTILWYHESISQEISLENFQMQVPKENARLNQKLFKDQCEYDNVHPYTNKKRNLIKMTGQMNHRDTKINIKPKQEIKF